MLISLLVKRKWINKNIDGDLKKQNEYNAKKLLNIIFGENSSFRLCVQAQFHHRSSANSKLPVGVNVCVSFNHTTGW